GPDQYEPVWWSPAQSPRRPAVGDVDGDGRVDLIFGEDGELAVYAFPAAAGRLPAPARLEARAAPDRVDLEWEAVPGALAYRVYRADVADGALAELPPVATWGDSGVRAGTTYEYRVAALGGEGREGLLSAPVRAGPAPRPRLTRAARLPGGGVAVEFDQAMGPTAAEAYRYRLEPGGAVGLSAAVDRGGARVIVGFSPAAPGGATEVVATGLRSALGAGLDPGGARTTIAAAPAGGRTLLLGAEVRSPAEIRLRFSAAVELRPGDAAAVAVDDGRLSVVELRPGATEEVIAVLSAATPLTPTGQLHSVRVSGLLDGAGRRIEGYAEVSVTVLEIGQVTASPNPYDPATGSLTVGPVPPGSRVTVYTLAGEVVWSGLEEGGDGGVQWDGTNDAGQQAATGVYLYGVVHASGARLGKVALVRR
ncbi:MAG: hypothetical protein ABIL09_03175, partial [Gemmatimonadota bacterium]